MGVMKWFWNTRPAQPHRGPQKWVPVLGKLQQTLQKGEYLPLRPMPMFESNFVQVTAVGSPVFLHQRANRLTLGVAASLPGLVLPDILLIARPQARDGSHLQLTRMIPLDFVHLYVHNSSARRLKLRLITGRCYYLALEAPDLEVGFLFDCWVRLAHMLQEPTTARTSRPLHPSGQGSLAKVPASTWHLQDLAHRSCTAALTKPTFPSMMPAGRKQKAAKRRFKSRAVGDSIPLILSQQKHDALGVKSTEKRSTPGTNPDRYAIQTHSPGTASITIRTIFSVVSRTVLQHQDCPPDSEEAPGLEAQIESPSHCVSGDNCAYPPKGSGNSVELLLRQQDIEDFLDTEASTLSPSFLDTTPHSPAMYLCPSCPSFPNPQDKARCGNPQLGQRTPPSQKAWSGGRLQWGAPVIMGQSQKVLAILAPSQKTSAVSATPCPSQKAPVVFFPPHRLPSQAWTAPPTCMGPQKAECPSAPEKEPLLLPTPSQQMPAQPPCPQAAVSPPVSWGKPLAQLPMALAGPPQADVTRKSKSEGTVVPGVLVGTQERNVIERNTPEVSLDLPFTTITKESKGVLLSQTQVVTVAGQQGQAKLEDVAHRRREEVSLDLPLVRSKEVEQRWVRTQQEAVEALGRELSRAFSVEGLMMAKPMIMANSREWCPGPSGASRPSGLSATSQAAAVLADSQAPLPLSPSWLFLLEGTGVVVRGPQEYDSWVKEKMQWGSEQPAQGPLCSGPGSISPVVSPGPVVSIPLPASCWEDLPQPPPPPPASSLRAKVLGSAPQPRPPSVPRKHPPATTESSSKGILQVPLEVQSVRDAATSAQITKGNLGFHHLPVARCVAPIHCQLC
ncbi:Golgi-associated RAB2 interactor protein 5B [Cavia porcellus]|uniref:Golgi-associated RAB2 interactor protein 5B n=1 Tax=Cavia porcellus TaxID=10141 RepID=UPI002FDF8BFA